MDISFNSHVSLTSNDDIKKICNKFFKRKKIDINHLNYIHKCSDGTVFYLCSNHFWIKHYISSGYMHVGAFEKKSHLSMNRYVLWDSLDSEDVILKDSKELINVEHGLTIVHKEKDSYGYFNFGNNNGGISSLNTYLNQLNPMNEFIAYFYAEAKLIIEKANEHRIKINPNSSCVKPADANLDNIENFIRLSQREMDCVEWYLKGKNSGEIAIILNISRRTVETHIENIKIKLGCTNLFQIGYCIAAMKHELCGFIPKL